MCRLHVLVSPLFFRIADLTALGPLVNLGQHHLLLLLTPLLASSSLCSKGWYVWSFKSEVQKLNCKTCAVLEEVFQRL